MSQNGQRPERPRLIRANGKMTEYPLLRPRVSIGSSERNDIVFQDDTISPFHAVILVSPNEYKVRDLGTMSGTFLNDTPVKDESALKPGDVVRFGNIKCFFLAPSNAAPSSAQRRWKQVIGLVLALLLLASFVLVDRWVARIRSRRPNPSARETLPERLYSPRAFVAPAR